eukprot:CAMPEP_0184504430 /NCGR_PEP_ID=MMETSP0113_2-20130426/52442_1 /TAXON_ID=91329 /ORGANISM="Norrisiella sphaerica, Strain BC52" /LENGTH=1435 /DNA_ID=CAMNT_0026894075 /DNA_START=115 /DNA_END=4422 /DNA_ORIENTATION=-
MAALVSGQRLTASSRLGPRARTFRPPQLNRIRSPGTTSDSGRGLYFAGSGARDVKMLSDTASSMPALERSEEKGEGGAAKSGSLPEGTRVAAELRSAGSAGEALRIAESHRESLDGWDLAICVSRVAEQNPKFDQKSATPSQWDTWQWVLEELTENLSSLSPRGLATLAVSLAKLKSSPNAELIQALEERVGSKDIRFDSQSLAGLLWGLSQSDSKWPLVNRQALVKSLYNAARKLTVARASDKQQTLMALSRLGVSAEEIESLQDALPTTNAKNRRKKAASNAHGSNTDLNTNASKAAGRKRGGRGEKHKGGDVAEIPRDFAMASAGDNEKHTGVVNNARPRSVPASRGRKAAARIRNTKSQAGGAGTAGDSTLSIPAPASAEDLAQALETAGEDIRAVLPVVAVTPSELLTAPVLARVLRVAATPRPTGLGRGKAGFPFGEGVDRAALREGWSFVRSRLGIEILEAEDDQVLLEIISSLSWLRQRMSLDVTRALDARLPSMLAAAPEESLAKLIRHFTSLARHPSSQSLQAAAERVLDAATLSGADWVSCIRSLASSATPLPSDTARRITSFARERAQALDLKLLRELTVAVGRIETTAGISGDSEKEEGTAARGRAGSSGSSGSPAAAFSPGPDTLALCAELETRVPSLGVVRREETENEGISGSFGAETAIRDDEAEDAQEGKESKLSATTNSDGNAGQQQQRLKDVLSRQARVADDAARIVWVFAQVRHTPQSYIMTMLQARIAEGLKELPILSVVNLFWSMTRIASRWPVEIMRGLQDSVIANTKALTPQLAGTLVWSLGRSSYQATSPAFLDVTENCIARSPDDIDSYTVSQVLWGWATLGHTPKPRTLRLLEKKLAKFLDKMPAQSLSNSVWALARLGHDVDINLLHSVEEQAVRKAGSLTPQNIGNILWAFSRIEYRPGMRFISEIEKRAYASKGVFTPRDVSNTVWAFGKLSVMPGSALLAGLDQVTAESLPRFSAQHLVNLLSGYANLSYRPNESVLAGVLDKVQEQMRSFNGQGVSSILWSLGRLSHRPPDDHIDAICRQILTNINSLHSAEVTNILWAFPRLAYRPRDDVLRSLETQALDQVWDFSAPNVATTLSAFAKLGYPPQTQLMRGLEQQAYSEMDLFEPQAVANLFWAFAKLGYKPGVDLVQSMEMAIELQIHDFTPQCIANTMWALSKLQHAPAEGANNAILLRCMDLADQFSPQNIANTLYGFSKLNFNPPNQLLSLFEKRIQATVATFHAPSIAITLTAFRRLRYPLARKTLDGLQRRAVALASSTKATEKSTILSSLDKMGVTPSKDLITAYESATNRAVAKLDADDVLELLWAFARLSQRPKLSLLGSMEEAIAKHVGSISLEDLTGVWWALARIQVEPSMGLLRILEQRTRDEMEQLSEKEKKDVMWAVSKMGLECLGELETSLKSAASG